MAYTEGGRIDAADYNQFVSGTNSTNINQVWADTYGQQALPAVSVGQKVFASNWQNFDDTLTKVANHQGTPFEPVGPGGFIPTAQIFPIEGYDIDVAAMIENKYNAAAVGTEQAGIGPYARQQGINNWTDWTVIRPSQPYLDEGVNAIVDDSVATGQYSYVYVGTQGIFGVTASGATVSLDTSWTFSLSSIAWAVNSSGVGRYIAVGSNNGNLLILSSAGTNLSVWTRWVPPPSTFLNGTDVANQPGGRTVVSTLQGAIFYSNNLTDWFEASSPTSAPLSSVAFNGSRFVAMSQPSGSNNPIALYSDNGITWNFAPALFNHPGLGFQTVRAVGGSRFVAVGVNGLIAFSDNGLSWVSAQLSLPDGLGTNYTMTDVTGNSDSLIISIFSNANYGYVLVGTNWRNNTPLGTTWTVQKISPDGLSTIASSFVSQTTIAGSGLYGTLVRTGSQSWQQDFVTTVDFSSAGSASNFFNAGGLVKINLSKSSQRFAGDTIWNSFLNLYGDIFLTASGANKVIAGTTYAGVTQVGGQTPDYIASSIGWDNLTTTDQLIYRIRSEGVFGAPGPQRVEIYARKLNSTQLVITTRWNDFDGSPISGGTGSAGTVPGTAPTALVSCISPSTAYISNSWNTVSINSSLSPVPTALLFEGTFYSTTSPAYYWSVANKNTLDGSVVWNDTTIASGFGSIQSITVAGVTYGYKSTISGSTTQPVFRYFRSPVNYS